LHQTASETLLKVNSLERIAGTFRVAETRTGRLIASNLLSTASGESFQRKLVTG
jgi:hypothetical protein